MFCLRDLLLPDSLFSAPTFRDFFKEGSSFLSLDISVNSTGFVIYSGYGDVLYGTFPLPEGTPAARRLAFRHFLLGILTQRPYWDTVFVEDVFGGSNFQTTRTLIELNCIVDDLKEQGLVNVGEIVRLDNKSWKTKLRKASNFKPAIKGMDDKAVIRGCMEALGFNPPEGTAQDVYDALGIAVAGSFQDADSLKVAKQVKLDDLSKGYRLKFFKSSEDLNWYLNRHPIKAPWVSGETQRISLDIVSESGDLVSCFHKFTQDCADYHSIFMIQCRRSQLGALGIKYKVDFPELKQSDSVFVLAYPCS